MSLRVLNMENEKAVGTSKTISEYYAGISAVPFYIMLFLFVLSNMLLIVNFKEPIILYIEPARFIINSVLLVFCVMYIAFSILLWKINPVTIAVAVGMIAAAGLGWNFIGQTNEFFCTCVAALLAILAYKRDYKVILKIFLLCHIVTVCIGAIGLPLGFTELAYKVQTVDNGFSLGLIYPNHVGRMAFLSLLVIWYLWGQDRFILTTIVAFLTALFMFKVVRCRTIAGLLIIHPILWVICRTICKYEFKSRIVLLLGKIWNIILVGLPFLCMLFTYIMGLNRLFFMERWQFGDGLYSLWMRFISAGIIFKVYGFPLFGTNVYDISAPIEFNQGHLYVASIIDNAFVYYLLAIGGIALIACMLWISFANYRAIKNTDYAFLLMSFLMCGYGIIEIVLFQFEHNFLFFYPLTATALAYKKKKTEIDLIEEMTSENDESADEREDSAETIDISL